MITVIYYFQDTGKAYQVLTGPDLGGFPEAPLDSFALLLTDLVELPGYVSGTNYVPLPEKPSSIHEFNWITKQWEDTRTLNDCRTSGLALVDELAGSARLRYITSVPGQAETYQKKEQQARDWAASGFAGDPPSFIAAEAEALGRDPQAIATEVIGLADYWGNVKGPQIEASRRKSKVAIETAENSSAIDGIVAQARAELGGL